MTTRARDLSARIMPYCQWLHDGTEWHLKPEAEAEIEAALLAAEDEALERAAALAENLYARRPGGPPTSSREQNGYVMAIREVVPAIRALMDRPASEAPETSFDPRFTMFLKRLASGEYTPYEAVRSIMIHFPEDTK